MRGRVMGLYGLIFRGGPAIGALGAGIISVHLGLRWPVVIGAVLLVAAWLLDLPDPRPHRGRDGGPGVTAVTPSLGEVPGQRGAPMAPLTVSLREAGHVDLRRQSSVPRVAARPRLPRCDEGRSGQGAGPARPHRRERRALLAGDVGTLYRMGANAFLMNYMSRFEVCGLNQQSYNERMRAVKVNEIGQPVG